LQLQTWRNRPWRVHAKNNDFDDNRQLEIADETGNTYTSETIIAGIEIPTANLGQLRPWKAQKIVPESNSR